MFEYAFVPFSFFSQFNELCLWKAFKVRAFNSLKSLMQAEIFDCLNSSGFQILLESGVIFKKKL